MKKIVLALALLSGLLGPAQAASTINPTQPSQSGPLSSGPVRNNFVAAFNDVNSILGKYAASTPPSNPINLQEWANTTTTPVVVFEYFNQTNGVWIPYATLNINSNVYTPINSSANFVGTPPITTSVSGGVATIGITLDANFAVASNKLAFAPIASGNMLANCTGSSAEPTLCTWSAFANVAIGATNGMLPYRIGGAWGNISTGTSGLALPLLNATALTWSGQQTIYAGTAGIQSPLIGTVVRGISLDGVISRFEADGYGAAAHFTGARADGTAAVPTVLVANDNIVTFGASGYNGAGLTDPAAAVRMFAAGTWSGTNQPTYIDFATTAQGDTTKTLTSRMRVENNGAITVAGTANEGAGTLNLPSASLYNNGTAPIGSGGGYVIATSNASVINGVSCALGGTCTITASAGTITYGSTTFAGGTGVPYNTTSGGFMTAAALAANAVFVTNGSSVPSFATTLPANISIPTPAIGFGIGAISQITATSTNTGFGNQLNIFNSGTSTTSGTYAGLDVALTGTSSANFVALVQSIGGVPTASISTGTGTTGGLTISSQAGPFNIPNAIISGTTIVPPANGGTGSNNGSFTISLGGNVVTGGPVTHSGAFASQFTITGATNMILPVGTHTLAGLDVVQTFSASQAFSAGLTASGIALGGATIGSNVFATLGSSLLGGAVNISGSGAALTIQTTGTSAIAIGQNGATNPAFQVNTSTASQANGLNITGQAAGNGLILAAISTATNESIFINAKGGGSVQLGAVSTGSVVIGGGGGGVTISSALTYGGVTLANSVVGTGSMVLATSPSVSNLTVTGSFTATNLINYSSIAGGSIANAANYFAGAVNALVPSSVIYQPETPVTFGTTTTFDFNTFINTAVTLTGNITTQTLSNVKAGQAGQIRFIQDGTGSRTTVWNSILKFSGGVTPALSTTAGAVDVLFYSCISTSICYASLNLNMK